MTIFNLAVKELSCDAVTAHHDAHMKLESDVFAYTTMSVITLCVTWESWRVILQCSEFLPWVIGVFSKCRFNQCIPNTTAVLNLMSLSFNGNWLPGYSIKPFITEWNNGLYYCAHFRPSSTLNLGHSFRCTVKFQIL